MKATAHETPTGGAAQSRLRKDLGPTPALHIPGLSSHHPGPDSGKIMSKAIVSKLYDSEVFRMACRQFDKAADA
ncbi:MAG: hypothetical protein ABSA05_15150, partial [Opitutaceae bacterium]